MIPNDENHTENAAPYPQNILQPLEEGPRVSEDRTIDLHIDRPWHSCLSPAGPAEAVQHAEDNTQPDIADCRLRTGSQGNAESSKLRAGKHPRIRPVTGPPPTPPHQTQNSGSSFSAATIDTKELALDTTPRPLDETQHGRHQRLPPALSGEPAPW